MSETDEVNSGPDLRSLYAKLEDLQTCHDLIKKHAASLQRVVSDLDDDISRALSEKTRVPHSSFANFNLRLQ